MPRRQAVRNSGRGSLRTMGNLSMTYVDGMRDLEMGQLIEENRALKEGRKPHSGRIRKVARVAITAAYLAAIGAVAYGALKDINLIPVGLGL